MAFDRPSLAKDRVSVPLESDVLTSLSLVSEEELHCRVPIPGPAKAFVKAQVDWDAGALSCSKVSCWRIW